MVQYLQYRLPRYDYPISMIIDKKRRDKCYISSLSILKICLYNSVVITTSLRQACLL